VALVAFLRGLNVGGRRSFRPSELASALERFEVVNVGAAGTFVIRRPPGRRALREAIARRLPFAAEIAICDGRGVRRLVALDPFAGMRRRPDLVPFVSVLARAPRSTPGLPLQIPGRGPWQVRVLAREGRFLVGLHRRRMKAIGALGELDQLYGVPATTRSWSTVRRIVRLLDGE